jgi:hypothetical protein
MHVSIPGHINYKEEALMRRNIQIPKDLCIISWLSLLLFSVAAVVLFPAAGRAAPGNREEISALNPVEVESIFTIPPCLGEFSVANQEQLETAIAAFNADRRGCLFRIKLTRDIYLTSSTPIISNDLTKLVIKGNGFSVNGQNIEGVRIFEIAARTVVTMRQIKITRANRLVDCRDDNSAGGGIRNLGKLTLIESTISFSKACKGGGIANIGDGISNRGMLILIDSTVSYNFSAHGGGIFNQDGSTTIIRSSIFRNIADFEGGGIANDSATLNIANSTISINECIADGGGGAIYSHDGTLNLTNCTLSQNEGIIGSAIKNNGGTLNLSNTIIANSSGSSACFNDGGGTVVAFSSMIEEVYEGEWDCITADGINGNIIGVDPNLGRLADNGGFTKTHRLLIGSPAINAGDNDLAVNPDGEPLTIDQRGSRRIFEGQVDMGAYEALIRWVPAEPPSPPSD